MSPEQIRLECLRLVHRHDRTPDDIVDTARTFENYVAGTTPSKPVTAPKGTKKDNPLS